MASRTNQTTPDAVASKKFAALWAALQNSFEGTNITRTVSRLLHMYQPEDGILAYERLLRTLYVLLEDFDTNGFRLLVSMVPPPKNVPESTIQEVFQKSTGFSRMISPVSQTHFDSSNEVGSDIQISNSDPEWKDAVKTSRYFPNKGEGSEKFDSSQTNSTDPDEFRGFPSNEICTTQTRIQTINQLYEPTGNYVTQSCHTCNHNPSQTAGKIQNQPSANSASSPRDYRMKWIYTPYLLRKNAICQSTQMYQDPLVIFQTADQRHMGTPVSQINQFQRADHSSTTEECLKKKEPVCIDLSPKEQKVLNNTKMDPSPETNEKNGSLRGDNQNFFKKMEGRNMSFETKIGRAKELNKEERNLLEKEVKRMQRAIQEDTYKMDVVQPVETDFNMQNFSLIPQPKNLEPKDLEVHKDLRQSVQKFLQRVKTVSVSLPKRKAPSPKNRKTVPDETSAFIDCWKKIITRSVLGRDPNPSSSDSDKNNSNVSKESIFSTKNKSTPKKECDKKVRRKKPNPPTRPKSERVAQRTTNRSRIDDIENRSSVNSIKKMNVNQELALEEPNIRFPSKSCELNSINMLQQANSTSDLANYKKQYYDALLSIQRAKVAVANSLAISSVGSTTGYDPYYFNYLHRQHQLMQHQQQYLLGRQFSNQRLLRTIPNNQNGNSWTNSNGWRYPSFGQFRFPRHPNAVYSTGTNPAAYSFLAQDTLTGEVRQYGGNQCDQLKPNIKRKKLDEIVGKLKEPENFVGPQSSSPYQS